MNLKKQFREFRSFDFLLLALVCGVVIFGILIIGSATHILTNGPSAEYKNQRVWFVSGLALLLLATFIDYHFIAKFYIPIYILNLFLLAIVIYIGKDDTSATRWIRFGGIGIQPSEFSKLFMIIFLAAIIDKYSDIFNKIHILFLILLSILLPTVLIMIQPSLSAALVLPFVSMFILYTGGLSYKYIISAIVVFVPSLVFFLTDLTKPDSIIIAFVSKVKFIPSYWIDRVLQIMERDPNSWSFYQTKQSIQAIGSGQLYGKGLYNGTLNQLSYLPENHNDFIFAVIGEEFGFWGCVTVIGVMLVIIAKCVLIAHNATDTLGRLLATGAASMLAFQVFVNVGVATGILPNTGMPFPFLSSGGSSMWISMVSIGLVLNVGMTKQKSIFEG